MTTQGSYGTAFSDGVRVGKVYNSNYNNGLHGIRLASNFTYDIVPVAAAANNIVVTINPAGAQYLPVVAPNAAVQSNINNVFQLDVARNISITGTAATTSQQFWVFGYDYWKRPLVENITGPVDTATVYGNKAFYYIKAIWVEAATVAAVSVGTGSNFGLPYPLPVLAYVNSCMAGNAPYYVSGTATLAAGTITVTNPYIQAGNFVSLTWTGAGVLTGFLSAAVTNGQVVITSSVNTDTGVIAYSFTIYPITLPDYTNPATQNTGDTRGTIYFPAANGVLHLTTNYLVSGATDDDALPPPNTVPNNPPVYPSNLQDVINLYGMTQYTRPLF